jgi:hypothetical protein
MGIEEKNSQTETWMDRELAGCKFRDVRLEKRFRKLIEQLSGALEESITMNCCGGFLNHQVPPSRYEV